MKSLCQLALDVLAGMVVTSSLASAQIHEDWKLLPGDSGPFKGFGTSEGVSGTTTIVGAIEDGSTPGSAYLFEMTTGQQFAKLSPADGATGDGFGNAVAIHGTTAIVGATGDDDNGLGSGSVYLFDTVTGQQLAKLLASDGVAGDKFGASVAISDTIAVVGAWGVDDNGPESGAAYLFDVATGQQLAKLFPTGSMPGDLFGVSVAISDTTAVVGAFKADASGYHSGSAFVFDANTGQLVSRLLADDGDSNAYFGSSVAIHGTMVVVGAPGDTDNGVASGAAYLFHATTGQQLAKLLPTDGVSYDYFGSSVAIAGSTAIVGAEGDDEYGSGSGSAYLFNGMTGQQTAKLLPSDGAATESFGYSVAIGDAYSVVGAPGDEEYGVLSGSAYVFDTFEDCNANGIPDYADIADGTSEDCDGDAQPDECQLENPANDWNGDGILDACVSANYCVATVNSTGVPGVIGAGGSPVVVENDFTLDAWDLPPYEFAYFLASESTAFVPGFGGSSGNLCLGAPQVRFNNSLFGGKVLNTGATGAVSFTLDLDNLPPGMTFDLGETWYFQLWYRDWDNGSTSNTTDGIEVLFR